MTETPGQARAATLTDCPEPHPRDYRCFDCATDEELAAAIPPFPGTGGGIEALQTVPGDAPGCPIEAVLPGGHHPCTLRRDHCEPHDFDSDPAAAASVAAQETGLTALAHALFDAFYASFGGTPPSWDELDENLRNGWLAVAQAAEDAATLAAEVITHVLAAELERLLAENATIRENARKAGKAP